VYDNTVKKTIDRYNLPKFVPYQIRHTYLTLVSLGHGRDIARAAAGHTTEAMTALYDHSDFEKVLNVVREQNRLYLARKAIGSDLPAADVPRLRVFSGE
jgi:integrase